MKGRVKGDAARKDDKSPDQALASGGDKGEAVRSATTTEAVIEKAQRAVFGAHATLGGHLKLTRVKVQPILEMVARLETE